MELQDLQHVELHFEDLSSCELVFGNLKQVLQVGWVDLLVLGSDQDGSDTQDVQLRLFYLLQGQEAVNEEHRHVESLGVQAELAVDVDNPLDQEGARCVFDLGGQLNVGKVVWR